MKPLIALATGGVLVYLGLSGKAGGLFQGLFGRVTSTNTPVYNAPNITSRGGFGRSK